LRNNTKAYGGKTHWSDSQNSDITAPMQLLLHAASLETFGYTLID